MTGDGTPDLVVGSGPGAAARVVVIDGASGRTVMTLAPFEDAFTGGTFVAAGDVDGDGRADVAVSADTASLDLRELVAQGLVRAEGTTRDRRYVLAGHAAR